ncbi:DUF2795 domain-containing protein [Methanoculleus sp. FWC-SCC1]|uniref:DUF2795 domain-containing protein n=1 Tax=Methanoculleus frigidifontis TaxID=2584085 RepID=A0ABT8MCY6_9EURY|nr:DUF2795 domain-containing protein [Methanoculleus sp. FWC-SCC1]MDN7025812.1 DUF2795 domain-containing protein [Methanoculleus sp. FWC-SCC1]
MAELGIGADSPVLEKYLKGVDYPASRETLIDRATRNDAGRNVIGRLESLPERIFVSPIDISNALAGSVGAPTGYRPGFATIDEKTRRRAAKAGGNAPHRARGLQAADEETRRRVASAGGRAAHEVRGLQAADEETRQRVARAGGGARHRARGLQAADEETRQRVARKGGEAPHRARGLQAADGETRKRVARKGGETSASGRKAR